MGSVKVWDYHQTSILWSAADNILTGTLLDNTTVKLTLHGTFLEAAIEGPADTVAEVAEQIGWLGAALRVPIAGDKLFSCMSEIKIRHETASGRPIGGFLEFEARPVIGATTVGQCWHKLFRNPAIAEGYPILKRSKYGTGLEIPVNMMSLLAESPRIQQYLGRRLLKGFSTAIVPTEKSEDAILWHLHYTHDGSRLPYPDLETVPCVDLGLEEVAKGRHILGWCTEASLHAGKLVSTITGMSSRRKSTANAK